MDSPDEQVIEVPKFIIEDNSTCTSRRWRNCPRSLQRSVEHSSKFQDGLQGFSSGQGSTALPSLERISERTERRVGGGLKIFSQDRASDFFISSWCSWISGPVEGGFRIFPQIKKSARWARRGRNCSPVEPIHASSTGLMAWRIRIDSVHGPFWKRLLSDHVQ